MKSARAHRGPSKRFEKPLFRSLKAPAPSGFTSFIQDCRQHRLQQIPFGNDRHKNGSCFARNWTMSQKREMWHTMFRIGRLRQPTLATKTKAWRGWGTHLWSYFLWSYFYGLRVEEGMVTEPILPELLSTTMMRTEPSLDFGSTACWYGMPAGIPLS